MNNNDVEAAIKYFKQGNNCYQRGDKQGAIDAYTQAIHSYSEEVGSYYNRGVIRSELGDKQGAMEDYTQAIRYDPEYADAYLNRGAVRVALMDDQGALEDYQKAAKLFSDEGNTDGYQRAMGMIEAINSLDSSSDDFSDNSSGNCFIATATFGTPYASEVIKYRDFRDRYLMKNIVGRLFIRFYYLFGPLLAEFVKSKPPFKRMMAVFLRKLLEFLPKS